MWQLLAPLIISTLRIEEADIREEKDRYFLLNFDEMMNIREDLVFDKHSCSLVNLGDVSNILENFERQCVTVTII